MASNNSNDASPVGWRITYGPYTELNGLIESAFEAKIDGGELDDDYIIALVKVVLGLSIADLANSQFAIEALLNRTLPRRTTK